MKAVILAGGFGTRLSEETAVRPKPMVEVGNRPILWHIMKMYSAHAINDFVICCGYRGDVIKDYFASYALRQSDVTFDLGKGSMEVHDAKAEPWRVTLVDTGPSSMTGGRLKRVADHLDDTFCLTYGDGVSDVDISETITLHRRSGREATMTIVQPPGRFGAVLVDQESAGVRAFSEKTDNDGAWVNGGFFVLEPAVLDRIAGDDTIWEQEPLRGLAHEGELNAYRHRGFWQPMDSLRDRMLLESLWERGEAPWKVW